MTHFWRISSYCEKGFKRCLKLTRWHLHGFRFVVQQQRILSFNTALTVHLLQIRNMKKHSRSYWNHPFPPVAPECHTGVQSQQKICFRNMTSFQRIITWYLFIDIFFVCHDWTSRFFFRQKEKEAMNLVIFARARRSIIMEGARSRLHTAKKRDKFSFAAVDLGLFFDILMQFYTFWWSWRKSYLFRYAFDPNN